MRGGDASSAMHLGIVPAAGRSAAVESLAFASTRTHASSARWTRCLAAGESSAAHSTVRFFDQTSTRVDQKADAQASVEVGRPGGPCGRACPLGEEEAGTTTEGTPTGTGPAAAPAPPGPPPRKRSDEARSPSGSRWKAARRWQRAPQGSAATRLERLPPQVELLSTSSARLRNLAASSLDRVNICSVVPRRHLGNFRADHDKVHERIASRDQNRPNNGDFHSRCPQMGQTAIPFCAMALREQLWFNNNSRDHHLASRHGASSRSTRAMKVQHEFAGAFGLGSGRFVSCLRTYSNMLLRPRVPMGKVRYSRPAAPRRIRSTDGV